MLNHVARFYQSIVMQKKKKRKKLNKKQTNTFWSNFDKGRSRGSFYRSTFATGSSEFSKQKIEENFVFLKGEKQTNKKNNKSYCILECET
jgi:hypothetical protein